MNKISPSILDALRTTPVEDRIAALREEKRVQEERLFGLMAVALAAMFALGIIVGIAISHDL